MSHFTERWPARAVPSARPSADRLFPLPLPLPSAAGGGACKKAKRRSLRRGEVFDQACESVAAANALFGGMESDPGPRTAAQTSAL